MAPKRERGVSIVAYGAGLLLVAAIVGTMVGTEVPGRVAEGCKVAICRVFGGDCTMASDGGGAPAAEGDEAGRPQVTRLPNTGKGRPADPSRARPQANRPLPKPVCTPGSLPRPPGQFQLHSHNDYSRDHPLEDALDHGATSVEADVYLNDDGELEVKHDEGDSAEGTLRSTYIDPLRERAQENGGQIYPSGAPFQLVVELKDGGDSGAEAAEAAFEQIEDLPPGVRVVFSGGYPSRDYNTWKADQDSEIGRQPPGVTFDIGPGEDCTFPPQLDPASSSYDPTYARNFSMFNANWEDCDDLSQEELNALVAKAHEAGLQVRFWGGPDSTGRICTGPLDCKAETKRKWDRWLEAGVDFFNTDHLTTGRDWLESCGED